MSSITIDPIASTFINQSFTVTGTLIGTPSFTYEVDAGATLVFPPASTAPPTGAESWSFVHPGFTTAGTHTVTVSESVTGASATASVVIQGATESPTGTRLTGTTGQIILADGTVVTLVQSATQGLQIAYAKNGPPVVDTVTQNVTNVLYWNHQLYQKNTALNWYVYQGTPGIYGQLAVSASGTTITDVTGIILLSNGTLVTLTGANGQIVYDGTLDPVTNNVILVLYYQGSLYQENGTPNWYTAPGNSQISGDPRLIVSTGFHTQGASIIDPNGALFTIKGVGMWEGYSNPAWWAGGYGMSWQDNLTSVKNLGFNCVRLGGFVNGFNNPSTGWGIYSPMLSASPDLNGISGLDWYVKVADWCGQNGIYFIIDIHSTIGGISTRFSSGGFTVQNNGVNWQADGISEQDYYNACDVIGRTFAGKPGWLGVDMCNEPWAGANDCQWGPGTGVDLRNMYTVGGNRIHAAVVATVPSAPLPLIIGQCTVDGSYDAYAGNPISLNTANKYVCSVHAYPSPWGNGTGFDNVGDSGTATQDSWTKHWGYLVANDTVPVWVGEWGGNVASTFPNCVAYWNTIVPYLAGQSGRPGAPTKRVHWSVWDWATPSQDPTGVMNSDTLDTSFTTNASCDQHLAFLIGLAPT